jgi:hypothetical protein
MNVSFNQFKLFVLVLAWSWISDAKLQSTSDIFNLPAVNIEWSRSMNSIGWSSNKDPPHQQNAPCIHPPPFGQQCTVHRTDAILSCLNSNCAAVICPDQKPYANGKPSKGITGPICQLRNHANENEKNHGMVVLWYLLIILSQCIFALLTFNLHLCSQKNVVV